MAAEHEIRVEHSRKRVRILLAGELVADTTSPLLVWEIPYFPTYYVPGKDVRAKLEPYGADADKVLGEAELFTVKVPGGAEAIGAARRYPASPARQLNDAVRFEWGAMSEWLEEDEPVYTHARDPHTRVDILASSRHVEVKIDGVTVADSTSPRILFETGLPPRYYLPLTDIRTDLLRPRIRRATARTRARPATGPWTPAPTCTRTWSGSTAPRCRRARRWPAWPRSTTRR